MRWRERLGPVSMCRVALLVPTAAARDLLVHVANAGAVQIATTASPDRVNGPAAALMRRADGQLLRAKRTGRKRGVAEDDASTG